MADKIKFQVELTPEQVQELIKQGSVATEAVAINEAELRELLDKTIIRAGEFLDTQETEIIAAGGFGKVVARVGSRVVSKSTDKLKNDITRSIVIETVVSTVAHGEAPLESENGEITRPKE